MSYKWLDNYHTDSTVEQTASGVFKVMLQRDPNLPLHPHNSFPVFGVSKKSIERAIPLYEAKVAKLKDVLSKMNDTKD